MNVEIHFYEQEKASVFLESFSEASEERLGEASLLVLFAIRTISNLGDTDTTARMADLFASMPVEIDRLASGDTTGGLELVAYRGSMGRKRFHAALAMDDRSSRFTFQAKGFGWLATGMNYYGPVSVLALIRHLAMKRPNDHEFLMSIAKAIRMVGIAHLNRQIQLSNHYSLASAIVAQTCLPQLA
jgi:hypothetical protein